MPPTSAALSISRTLSTPSCLQPRPDQQPAEAGADDRDIDRVGDGVAGEVGVGPRVVAEPTECAGDLDVLRDPVGAQPPLAFLGVFGAQRVGVEVAPLNSLPSATIAVFAVVCPRRCSEAQADQVHQACAAASRHGRILDQFCEPGKHLCRRRMFRFWLRHRHLACMDTLRRRCQLADQRGNSVAMSIESVLIHSEQPAKPAAGTGSSTEPRYSLLLSTDAEVIEAAQRLRYDVFSSEPGFTVTASRPRA